MLASVATEIGQPIRDKNDAASFLVSHSFSIRPKARASGKSVMRPRETNLI
jgi:hypothetical protein